MNDREVLIEAFNIHNPFAFEYRKKPYKLFRPAIREMMKEGLVKQVSVDQKIITFQYTPKK